MGELRCVPAHVQRGFVHSSLRTDQIEAREYDSWNGRGNPRWLLSRNHPRDYSRNEDRTISLQARTDDFYPKNKWCDPFPLNRDLTGDEEQRLSKKKRKTLTTNLLTLGAIPNQPDERLITHPSCSDWSSIRKAG